MPKTLFDKIWDAHLVARRADGRALIYMDRNLVDDVRAPHAFGQLERGGHSVRRKDLTMAVQDHSVLTDGRDANDPTATAFTDATRSAAVRHGIRLFDLGDPEQGISHVVAPELGLVLPGATHVCADSHAPTVGALGALAFGCGTTELVHVLATQTMALARPRQMRIKLEGVLGRGVSAKDVILHTIAKLGIDAGRGYAVEFSGAAIAAMPVEGRFTVCNMATELGARTACVAPDEATLQWLAGRPFVPVGEAWERALAAWSDLASDDDATVDQEVAIDCSALEPEITWGTDPSQVVPISGRVPDPAAQTGEQQAGHRRAIDYMGLTPGAPIAGLPINRVFIGSCTNARLSDLESAAAVLRGRRVADGVVAVAVPGSTSVKRAAEARGLDQVFRDAGVAWHSSGCSLCAGGNRDAARPGERYVSTGNRNFEGRQGAGVRTHLASPAMAAAAAVAGRIVDVRRLLTEG
ncbi:MAG: 3-isopropylmalate dehydratase large subunit [Xanthobacteraceae bacterium]